MKAVAVLPGKPNSVHLRDIPAPKLTDQPHPHVCRIPEGRAVLVKVLQIGVDATDREINEALYGNAPPGGEHLVIGHESFGQVVEVGDKVTEVKPGDYVSCTVRRPGGSLFDLIGRNDITSEEVYYERGINLCHGYLTEYVRRRCRVHGQGAAEPQASRASWPSRRASAPRRSSRRFWRSSGCRSGSPKRAFVLGAGQIGLLATMMLKLRGLEVYTLATKPGPHRKSEIAEAYGATYVSTRQTSLADLAKQVGKPDLIFEATGNAEVCFRAMEVLAHQRRPDLDEHHRGQARGDRRRRQDQPRMGARQQAAGLERQRQPPALRAGHPGPVARRADLSGVTERILTHPGRRPRQLQGNDAAAGRQGSAQGLRQRRREVIADLNGHCRLLQTLILGSFHEQFEYAQGSRASSIFLPWVR